MMRVRLVLYAFQAEAWTCVSDRLSSAIPISVTIANGLSMRLGMLRKLNHGLSDRSCQDRANVANSRISEPTGKIATMLLGDKIQIVGHNESHHAVTKSVGKIGGKVGATNA